MSVNESLETKIIEMQYQIDELRNDNVRLNDNETFLRQALEKLAGAIKNVIESQSDSTPFLTELIKEVDVFKVKCDDNAAAIDALKDTVKTQQKSLDNIIDSFGEILTRLGNIVEEVDHVKNNISGLEHLYHCMDDQINGIEKEVKKIKKKIKHNKVTVSLS